MFRKSAIVSALTALLFCSSLAFADTTPLEIQESTRINELNRNFLKVALDAGELKNTMVSSVSMFYALSILELGATGETQAFLRRLLLNNPSDSHDITAQTVPLASQLESQPQNPEHQLGQFQLHNAVWATNGKTTKRPFVFSDSFIERARDSYAAEVETLDFLVPGASSLINQWAEDKTNGLIEEIIDDKTLRDMTWIISNAAYFEGAWANPMSKISPRENYRFTTHDGSILKVDSIKSSQSLRVFDNTDGSLNLSIPFRGGKYSMVIQIPSPGESDIETWLRNIAVPNQSAAIGTVLTAKAPVFDVRLRMPAFSFSQRHDFRVSTPATAELGLLPLFTDHAELDNLVNKDLSAIQQTKVGIIRQDTRIELDEKGVKAAAVTLIGGISKSTIPRRFDYRDIDIDRPFLWSIVEEQSQTILFSGVLSNPLDE